MNKFIEEDIYYLSNIFEFKEELKDKTILITGGTGLVGSLILNFLSYINEKFSLNIKILSIGRNKNKISKLPSDIKWFIQDITEKISYSGPVDYIIHTASPTQSLFLKNKPVETISSTVCGALNLLTFAIEHSCSSFVYLSSIEIYGEIDGKSKISENEYGHIDFLNPRSGYSEGKRLIECLCSSYSSEYGLNCKIARLTQTFGAGIMLDDNRVFAQFIRSIISSTDIILHTTGESAKPYIYTLDAINAIFYILFKGAPGNAYNVANDQTYITIIDMAKMLIDKFNNSISAKIVLKDNMGYAPITKVNLNVDKLKSLGWNPQFDLFDMYDRTIKYYKNEIENR